MTDSHGFPSLQLRNVYLRSDGVELRGSKSTRDRGSGTQFPWQSGNEGRHGGRGEGPLGLLRVQADGDYLCLGPGSAAIRGEDLAFIHLSRVSGGPFSLKVYVMLG